MSLFVSFCLAMNCSEVRINNMLDEGIVLIKLCSWVLILSALSNWLNELIHIHMYSCYTCYQYLSMWFWWLLEELGQTISHSVQWVLEIWNTVFIVWLFLYFLSKSVLAGCCWYYFWYLSSLPSIWVQVLKSLHNSQS